MKKKALLGSFILIIATIVFLVSYPSFKSDGHKEILDNLHGTIYFTERVDGALTLFKADASLENKTVVYSHAGKGKNDSGYNDNIIDFFYDEAEELIYLIAMHDGMWSLFSLDKQSSEPTLISGEELLDLPETNYLNNEWNDLTAFSKKGTIYLRKSNVEQAIKKFRGIYDDKFTGYDPIGFTPDGKYLLYYSMEHATPIGTMLAGIFGGSIGHTYMMDLSTKKSVKYANATDIQWMID